MISIFLQGFIAIVMLAGAFFTIGLHLSKSVDSTKREYLPDCKAIDARILYLCAEEFLGVFDRIINAEEIDSDKGIEEIINTPKVWSAMQRLSSRVGEVDTTKTFYKTMIYACSRASKMFLVAGGVVLLGIFPLALWLVDADLVLLLIIWGYILIIPLMLGVINLRNFIKMRENFIEKLTEIELGREIKSEGE